MIQLDPAFGMMVRAEDDIDAARIIIRHHAIHEAMTLVIPRARLAQLVADGAGALAILERRKEAREWARPSTK